MTEYHWVKFVDDHTLTVYVEVEEPGYVKVAYQLLAELMFEAGFEPLVNEDTSQD